MMKKINLLITLFLFWPFLFCYAGNKISFYDYFVDKTMRFDYYHNGNVNEELDITNKGMFRSAANCIMFTRKIEFCPACQWAINLVIDQYSK